MTGDRPRPRRALLSRVLPRAIGVAMVVHGLIHLLGAASAWGWVDVPGLEGVRGAGEGALWLAAACTVTAAATGLLLRRRTWWLIGLWAAVVSQVAVLTAWSEARAGTIANALLVATALHGWRTEGRHSMRNRYRTGVAEALADVHALAESSVITEDDLLGLPRPVATYLRRAGSVGAPRVSWFRATLHGRIRASADGAWTTYTGEQVNTFRPVVSRRFWLDASMAGLPVDVLHVLTDGAATMRAAACSLIPVAQAAGPEMDRSESVTLFNDLCFLAPAALVDAPVIWEVIDEHRVSGTYRHGEHAVRAELVFDDDGDLVDFVSDDRLRAGAGGTFTAQRWSTPLAGYRTLHGRRLATDGSACWHAPEREGTFAYIEMTIDDVVTDRSDQREDADRHAAGRPGQPR